MKKIPKRHVFIDVAGETIVKLKYNSRRAVLSPSTCTSTTGVYFDSASTDAVHLSTDISQVPDMLDSMPGNGLDADDLLSIKIPPSEPVERHQKSPERMKYLADLHQIKVESDMEFRLHHVSSFHLGSVEDWDDDSIRSWLYVYRDERPADRQGSQDSRWLKFSHKLFNVYGVDKSPTECMRQVQVL